MLNQEELTRQLADYKKDAKKRFDAALAALLTLAWKRKDLGGDFSFEADSELYNEALAVCRDLSDKCAEDAKKRAFEVMENSLDYYDEDVAWKIAEDSDGESIITRFDMAGSHLIKLVQLWAAVAFTNGFTKSYTQISIVRFLSNPYASGLFGAWGKDILKWGRGYSKNLVNQITVIGQNAIIDSARRAEWVDANAKGATYYVRRRGSSYNCDTCEEIANIPIPIDTPFERSHSRCCCYPEYFYEPMPE